MSLQIKVTCEPYPCTQTCNIIPTDFQSFINTNHNSEYVAMVPNQEYKHIYMLGLRKWSSNILLDIANYNTAEHQLLLFVWHVISVLSSDVTEKRTEM